jgi:hypothetical protein
VRSRPSGLSLAFAALAAIAALALATAALLDSPSAAHAGSGGGKKSCKSKSEQQGCPLPNGAVYFGSSAAGKVTVTVASGETYVEAQLAQAQLQCTLPPPPSYIIGYATYRGKAPKIGGSVTFVAKRVEAEGSAAGPVKFTSAKTAHASLAVADEESVCKGSIELNLTRR